ncbi:uncharacterized protein LOC101856585 [Aplysia californica]|uniref:Uncharacterized protein LOC101856585 n=1 Tax=Aplysia californica TaxID=6500 RepID=A0ABM0JV00_APLCA|nr:uncharacterized protein LOC101856585 [Aplysia californica]
MSCNNNNKTTSQRKELCINIMRQPKYRLSPNEVERLVKEETEQRRKLRIVQVREQAKTNAAKVRNDVRREKSRLLNNMASEIKGQLEAEKGEKVRKLEEKYENTLRTIGEGHREVHLRGDGQNRAEWRKKQKEAELAAHERFKVALEREKKEAEEREFKEKEHIYARQAALEKERERAAEIASLPAPPPDISVELEKSQKKAIPMVDMKAFATTHYHIPDYHVVKAAHEEQEMYDAKSLAKETDLKLRQDLKERRRALHEQAERARIRGNQALKTEILKHDLGDMLHDLSLLQRKDRRRRQNVVADLPKQVFIPPERCMEERDERELEMERRFDEIYMQQHKLEANQVRSFDVSDYPSGLESSGETSLDVGASRLAEQIPLSRINPAVRELSRQPASEDGSSVKPPDTVLKQLLTRIKEQRSGSGAGGKRPGLSVPWDGGGGGGDAAGDSLSARSGESRAEWQRAPAHQEVPKGLEEKTPEHSAIDLGFSPDGISSSLSGADSVAMDNNERMIEELRRRIELIESEKARVSQQYKSQVDKLTSVMSPFGGEDLAESTLREVDIDTTHESEASGKGGRSATGELSEREMFTRVLPPEVMSPDDLANAAANLRPITGILKGVKNTQYELMTSNGFLPVPETYGVHKTDDDDSIENKESRRGLTTDLDHVGDCKSFDKMQGLDFGQGLAQGEYGMGHVDRYDDSLTPSLPSQLPAGFSLKVGLNTLSNQPLVSRGTQGEALEFGRTQPGLSAQAQWLGSSGPRIGTSGDPDLSRKVREYQENARQRQLNLDEETLRKVREYQQRLLDTDAQRKQMLSDIRADIEQRRGELFSSQASSLSRASQKMYQTLAEQGQQTVKQQGEDAISQRQDALSSGKSSNLSVRYDPKTWEPIKPFIADERTQGKGLVSPRKDADAVTSDILQRDPHKDVDFSSQWAEGIISRSGRAGSTDKIRKSLIFDDLERSGIQSPATSWKDVLNETSATANESHLVSSEEDRGSPILATSGSAGRPESSEDKSNNSVTGSSSLNGSVLVARAEERRLGFERRQQELREQLEEIQQQKDSILKRYQDGQRALQRQQEELRSKLSHATSQDATQAGEPSAEQQRIRKKLAEVNSQLGIDPPSYSHRREKDGKNDEGAVKSLKGLRSTEEGNSSRGSDGGTGSSGSVGVADVSSESYLEEISYQRINSPPPAGQEDKALPSSAFTRLSSSDTAGRRDLSFPMVKPSSESATDARLQTWASVLLSSSSSTDSQGAVLEKKVGKLPQTMGFSTGATEANRFSRTSVEEKADASDCRDDDFWSKQREAVQSVSHSQTVDVSKGAQITDSQSSLSSGPWSQVLMEHRPHELSTILEVDTPTSSAKGSVVSRSAATSHSQGQTQGAVSVRTSSSQSLSSAGSQQDLGLSSFLHGGHTSGARMDVFPDLPYTFPQGTAAAALSQGGTGGAYDLSGQKNTPTELPQTGPTHRAKRSLDFSSQEVPARSLLGEYPELTADEDIFHTPMPALVELTPLKTAAKIRESVEADKEKSSVFAGSPGGLVSSGCEASVDTDNSSLQVSGYSEYLRGYKTLQADAASDDLETTDLSLTLSADPLRVTEKKEEEDIRDVGSAGAYRHNPSLQVRGESGVGVSQHQGLTSGLSLRQEISDTCDTTDPFDLHGSLPSMSLTEVSISSEEAENHED